MDKQPERKWDEAALAGDAVTKKMIAEFLVGKEIYALIIMYLHPSLT
jgi:hypothetical protein